MKFRFNISGELLTDLVFISLIGMYFLGLAVIPNIYLHIYFTNNFTEHKNIALQKRSLHTLASLLHSLSSKKKMEQSYIVQLYIRCLFRWKLHDFYPYRAYAFKACRALESVGIRVKLVEVSSDGEKGRIYETREDLRRRSPP